VASLISNRYKKSWRPAKHPGTVEWINQIEELDLRHGEWMLLARNFIFTKPFAELARYQGVPYVFNGYPSVPASHIKAIQNWEALRRGERIKSAQAKALSQHIRLRADFKPGQDYGIDDLNPSSREIWHQALELMSFSDRQYYLEILKNGFKLTREPKIHIGTIHSVKGDEADNVVVATDLTWRSHQSYMDEPDDEHRVFYVGLTRTKKHLKILTPQSTQWYEIG
jgi:superfamily I DNA/RNA helicase